MLAGAIVAAMIAAGPLASPSWANQIYTDQAAFLAAVESGYYLESFDGLSPNSLSASLAFSDGTFSYDASATNGLFPFANPGDPGDIWLGPNTATNPVVFTMTGGNVTAVGGYFFPTDLSGDPSTTNVTATLDNGDVFSVLTSSPTNFIGFTTQASIVSLSLSVDNSGAGATQPFRWATANDLIVGTASVGVIPEPGSIVLGASGLAFVGLAAARRRISRTRPGAEAA
jgi:hypothetical protein